MRALCGFSLMHVTVVCSLSEKWDPINRTYTEAGCTSQGISYSPRINSTVMNCACHHLTEFAILEREASAIAGPCGMALEGGQVDYLIFLILYSIVFTIASVQEGRIVWHGLFRKYWLMSAEHLLIMGIAFFRALNQLIYYRFINDFTLQQQILISGMPFLFLTPIYSFVLVAWSVERKTICSV
jgi:hypothetical protein